MAIETGPALGAGILLALAALARSLAMAGRHGPWGLIATAARGAAGVALLAALILTAWVQGRWSPYDMRQVALGLALATVGLHLALTRQPPIGDAGPLADLVALALAAVGLALRPGGPALTLAQRTALFYARWVLFLVGAGAVTVAGSAGLTLALSVGMTRHNPAVRRPPRVGLYGLLTAATSLALVMLGGGLAVSTWQAWRTVGLLSSGDPREGWMAITWLVAANSLLAWRLEKRPGRWAAALAVLAAMAALLGLFLVMEVRRLLGL